jgi:fibronectin type 3 domain-containing protein
LTPGGSYTVLLHFAETYFSAPANREFNVAINGTTVLTNLDVYAKVGKNAALLETFTATANSSGQIVVAFATGAKDQPLVMGIEVRGGTVNSCTTVPSAPTGLAATASSSSVIGLTWTAVTPPANCTISSYSVFRSSTSGFSPSATTLVASGLTSTSYSNTGLAASTTYYYVVKALDSDGTSAASAQAQATTQPATSGTEIVALAAGGPAESNSGGGDYPFVADEYFVGGGANIAVGATINLTQPGVNAAPMGVYQHGRAGVSTYTIPGLTAGGTYSVLLHFAETYFSAPANREFNVAINGTKVLTNLDVFATVGKDAALLETFTATASSSGQIVIAFTVGAKDQPLIMGIEIRGTSATGCSAVPSAPTGLVATASSSSAIGLTWTPVTPQSNCTIDSYSVYGGTSPNPTALIASGITGASYSNTGLAASTTYYYVVKVLDADGTSAASAQASATTQPAAACTTVPSAPTGLTATATSSSAIGLSWAAVPPPADCTIGSYSVYGGTSANQTTLIASGVTGTNYSNTALAPSTTYYYLVKAVDADGTSAASSQATATTLGTSAPAPPTGLTAVGSSSQQIDLRWVASGTLVPNTAP